MLKFFIPDPNSIVSGGNIYNRFLIEAWNQQFEHAVIIDKLPSDDPRNKNLDKEIVIVDTLFLDYFSENSDWRKNKSKTILMVHHLESLYPPEEYLSSTYFNEFEKTKLALFDAFLVSSHFTKKYLKENGIIKPILVVPPALSFQPKVISGRSASNIRGLIVANLVERKGILPFLEELKPYGSTPLSESLKIDILGTDQIEKEYAIRCKNYVEENPTLKNMVQFHGTLPQNELRQYYQEANLFISTSFMETFGMALQEAVAFRLPMIALNKGNIPAHIVVGQNGYILESTKLLVKKLIELTNDHHIFHQLVKSANFFRPYESYTWKEAALSLKKQLLEC